MSPKRIRYKLLLDEMFPRRENFPLLNRTQDVKHLVHDFNKAGISDEAVVKLARTEKRIIITKNSKHFRRLSQKYLVDIIGVSEPIPHEELDAKTLAYLSQRKQHHMKGLLKKLVKSPRRKV